MHSFFLFVFLFFFFLFSLSLFMDETFSRFLRGSSSSSSELRAKKWREVLRIRMITIIYGVKKKALVFTWMMSLKMTRMMMTKKKMNTAGKRNVRESFIHSFIHSFFFSEHTGKPPMSPGFKESARAAISGLLACQPHRFLKKTRTTNQKKKKLFESNWIDCTFNRLYQLSESLGLPRTVLGHTIWKLTGLF